MSNDTTQGAQPTQPITRVIRLATCIKRLRRYLERRGQSLIVTPPRSQRFAELGKYAIKTDAGEVITRVNLEARLRSYGLLEADENIERPTRWLYRIAKENGAIEFLPGEYPTMVAAAAAAGDDGGLQIIGRRLADDALITVDFAGETIRLCDRAEDLKQVFGAEADGCRWFFPLREDAETKAKELGASASITRYKAIPMGNRRFGEVKLAAADQDGRIHHYWLFKDEGGAA